MSRAASARLFAALDPPEEIGTELLRWARGALREAGERDARLLAPESLHVTLLFLGELPFEEIEALAAVLAETADRHPPLELETGAPVWLPPRRPRALAVELHDPDRSLAGLQRDLAGGLCAVAGLPVPRRFRAHLTLARTRSGVRTPAPLPATPALRFGCWEVVLYRSFLEPSGARYERLAAAALAG